MINSTAEATARRLHRSAARLAARSSDREDLGLARRAALEALEREGPLSASVVAERLRVQPQSMTRLLAALEDQALIDRALDPGDRRRSIIALSDAGAAALAADRSQKRGRLARVMMMTLSDAEIAILDVASGLMDRLTDELDD